MQKITPFIWFDDKAEEAVNFYVSLFKNAKIKNIVHMGPEVPGPQGKVMVVSFEIEGQEFTALNGGPGVFNPPGAISLVINCDTQEEVDMFWEKLSADGGKPGQCGWIADKFGVMWQVVPRTLDKFLGSSDREKAKRATEAMLKMTKLDINVIEAAYDGK